MREEEREGEILGVGADKKRIPPLRDGRETNWRGGRSPHRQTQGCFVLLGQRFLTYGTRVPPEVSQSICGVTPSLWTATTSVICSKML